MTIEFINKTEVADFLFCAKDFCKFIELPAEKDSVEFLKKTRLLLLNLYQKGLFFPLYNGELRKYTDDLLGENYFIISKLIEHKLGRMDFYTHTYDPIKMNEDKPVVGSLSDDIADVYRDLKRALLQLDTDSEIAKEDALWSLHFLFRAHYSEHIINGIYAIHFFLQDK